ncbi:MAG: hypothetical protein WCT49_00365 [Candidatus Paceibacterota bacterium]|jgi:hypothetical protein|nr:hypothetical protein [Candidatus Paceibacterota bacterium]
MRKDKEKAIQLRHEGKSYREIKKELSVPLSTLSEWLAPYDWSKNIAHSLAEIAKEKNTIRLRSLNGIRNEHLRHAYEDARSEAVEEFQVLKYHPLFIAGIMLYWGEGDKVTKGHVKLTNTDTAMVKIYVNFLLSVCRVEKEKIRCSLLLYPDLDDEVCKNNWRKNAGLENIHFGKSTVIQGRHKTKRLQTGICIVSVSSSYFKEKILIWTKMLAEELISPDYYNFRL